MNNFETLKKTILNEAFQTINEDIQEYRRRKAVLESFGYEFDMDKLPKLDKQWAKDVKKNVMKIVESLTTEKNKFKFFDIVEFNKRDNYVVARIFGGTNGGGNNKKWVEYNKSITKVFEKILETNDCYLVQLVNDCPDDVFTLDIAIRKDRWER
jgi:hypothetical protein